MSVNALRSSFSVNEQRKEGTAGPGASGVQYDPAIHVVRVGPSCLPSPRTGPRRDSPPWAPRGWKAEGEGRRAVAAWGTQSKCSQAEPLPVLRLLAPPHPRKGQVQVTASSFLVNTSHAFVQWALFS